MDDKKQQKKEENKEEILNQVEDENTNQDDKSKETGSIQQIEDKFLQQLEELDQKYKRALADYQNVVRRTREEKQEWAKLSNKELILKILPILDTLMLAEKHTKDQTFALTVGQFLQVLEQDGVKRIKTIGEEFDPHTMEAVSTTDGEKGKVLDELRAGYMFGEIVLRPAQVIVGA